LISRRTLAAVLSSASLLIVGCASVERTAFSPESKKQIKTVAVIAVAEPDKYSLNPGQLSGGSALYAFGALGGLVLGSIEATRAENATNEFTAAVKPTSPDVARHWNESIVSLLKSKGYDAVQIAELPKKPDGKELDCSSVAGKFDAVFISSISTGYEIESGVDPRVFASVRFASSNCVDTHFSDGIIYSSKPLGKFTHIERDPSFTFPSRAALLADPQKAKDGLRKGLTEIAKRATSDL
jgi:hypothetical protein